MHSAKALILAASVAASLAMGQFNGQRALESVQAMTSLGPRIAGSPAMVKQQAYLAGQLKAAGWNVIEDSFTAKTPVGTMAFKNLIAQRPGTSGKAVAITGHYDTKRFPFVFVGANDAGSSAGVLVELARALKATPTKNEIFLVFFDGEEAMKEWTATDSLYGSRHLAEKWQKERVLDRLTALINIDMIGDRDLHIVSELYSSEALRRVVWQAAARVGAAKNFDGPELAIEDDHVPFLKKGVRALDLIDFEYGPAHSWWHTKEDTLDKLSAASLQTVGNVLIETLKRLD